MRTEPCKGCGKPMLWARTAKGKMMPLDAEPSPEGTWGVTEDGRCYYQESPGLFDGMPHTSHWATCPKAHQFRRPKDEQQDHAK